jgi:DNA polymerase III delta prime subunit
MKIFYGPKGTGKTQAIIESANKALDQAKGHIIFVTDSKKNSIDLAYKIRFVDVTSFNIKGACGFRGFIKGIVAANGDNEFIFVDGISRITEQPLAELGDLFDAMEALEKDFGVKFVLTCSASKEELPDFILKHVD